jgi:hypothetical protein
VIADADALPKNPTALHPAVHSPHIVPNEELPIWVDPPNDVKEVVASNPAKHDVVLLKHRFFRHGLDRAKLTAFDATLSWSGLTAGR